MLFRPVFTRFFRQFFFSLKISSIEIKIQLESKNSYLTISIKLLETFFSIAHFKLYFFPSTRQLDDALFDIIHNNSAAITKLACSTQRSMSDCHGTVMRFEYFNQQRLTKNCRRNAGFQNVVGHASWMDQIKWSDTMSEHVCVCLCEAKNQQSGRFIR